MAKEKGVQLILISLIISLCLIFVIGASTEHFALQTDDVKAFKQLKEKMTDSKTGLPKTLAPSLIKGNDRAGYQVAKEIPEILAQLPCFCGCEAVGHENLLDCFVDEHAVG